jgi:hypothetical protein
MNPGTLTASTFTLKQGTSAVAGSVSVTGATATFKPSLPLAANKVYTGTITTGAKDAAGNSLASAYVWSFTSDGGTDLTAPAVITVVPANASITAPVTTKASITFSEAMNPATINSTSISLKQGTTLIAGAVTLSGTTATFTPSAALAAGKVYTGTVTTSAKDAAGNALAANYTWSFTTAATSDVTAPVVSSVVPANNATAIAVSSKPAVTFSEAMDAATITSSTFTLKQGSASIPGVVAYTGTTATFTPSAVLAANQVYTGTITTGAKDASGNAIAANYTWSFTTAAAADITAPTISAVAPANNGTSIAVNSKATATFSEAMNAATITGSTFTLKQGSTNVAGTVTYTGTTATFTPSAALAASTVYTATISTGAKDAAGNALAANYNWSFTTAAPSDITAPSITTVAPANNATSVALNGKATATFNEAMNAATITSSTFTLKRGSTSVAGNVTYSGTTATFTPSAALTGSTVYTASITTGAKDAAGNSLASAYTWSFTTVAVATGKSFATDVMPILGVCNDCHTHDWTTSSNASTFYTNLVNSGHVNPSSPTSGKIYSKINGSHGSSSISTTQRTTILTWVTEGSKNN